MRRGLLRLAYRVASPLANAWWWLRGSHREGAKCVIVNAGEVLLVRHSYGDRRRWDLPGGFVGRGEEAVAAAGREMREELGLILAPGDLRDLGALEVKRGRRRDTIQYFHVELADRTPAVASVELAEIAWFAPGALPRRLGDHVARALTWVSPPAPGSGLLVGRNGGRPVATRPEPPRPGTR